MDNTWTTQAILSQEGEPCRAVLSTALQASSAPPPFLSSFSDAATMSAWESASVTPSETSTTKLPGGGGGVTEEMELTPRCRGVAAMSGEAACRGVTEMSGEAMIPVGAGWAWKEKRVEEFVIARVQEQILLNVSTFEGRNSKFEQPKAASVGTGWSGSGTVLAKKKEKTRIRVKLAAVRNHVRPRFFTRRYSCPPWKRKCREKAAHDSKAHAPPNPLRPRFSMPSKIHIKRRLRDRNHFQTWF